MNRSGQKSKPVQVPWLFGDAAQSQNWLAVKEVACSTSYWLLGNVLWFLGAWLDGR
jgi:hypothetical protein